MSLSEDRAIRDHVLYLLRGGGAHLDFDTLISDFPIDLINTRVEGVPYTAWQLLEHMRIAQWDILRFSINPGHVSPEFPAGYWPAEDVKATPEHWHNAIAGFHSDLKEMEELVENESTYLLAEIPHGNGQTILREALLVADHNAYHLGALAVFKRILTGNRMPL